MFVAIIMYVCCHNHAQDNFEHRVFSLGAKNPGTTCSADLLKSSRLLSTVMFIEIINLLVMIYTFDKPKSTLGQTSQRFGHTSLMYPTNPGKNDSVHLSNNIYQLFCRYDLF